MEQNSTTLEYKKPKKSEPAELVDASDDNMKRIADALEYLVELERIKVKRDYVEMPPLSEWIKSRN